VGGAESEEDAQGPPSPSSPVKEQFHGTWEAFLDSAIEPQGRMAVSPPASSDEETKAPFDDNDPQAGFNAISELKLYVKMYSRCQYMKLFFEQLRSHARFATGYEALEGDLVDPPGPLGLRVRRIEEVEEVW